jgi:hypothetical protein
MAIASFSKPRAAESSTTRTPHAVHRQHTGGQVRGRHSPAGVPRYLRAGHASVAIGEPGAPREREADQMAQQAMRRAAPERRADAAQNPRVAPAAAGTLAEAGTGQPLDHTTRAYFEPRFGHRFDGVRTHTDPQAAQWNAALGARAFAHGADIYFAAGNSPQADALTAHELAHIVQQRGTHAPHVIQCAPDPTAERAADADTGTAALISEATQAIDEAGIAFRYLPAEIDGDAVWVLFENVHVQRLFRHLLREWLGAGGTSEPLENTIDPAPPPWVAAFRAKALNLRAGHAQDADGADAVQRQLADLAVRLADSVQAETPAQSLRRLVVQSIDKRIGTVVMSQGAINTERAKPAKDGLTPANFTTCIAFFGQVVQQVTQQSGLSAPLLSGPNSYKEINPVSGKLNLPAGAWHACTPDSPARPKPGDLLIFTFAKAETLQSGGWVGKDYFAHISILRAVEPLGDGSPELAAEGYTEKFISVDGGGTTAAQTVRYFAPGRCLTQGPGTIVRTLKGWIDVENLAQARLAERTPVQA